mgnify:CR=1 FL=1
MLTPEFSDTDQVVRFKYSSSTFVYDSGDLFGSLIPATLPSGHHVRRISSTTAASPVFDL